MVDVMGETAEQQQGEQRASLEDPQVPISSANIVNLFGMSGISASGVNVTVESAMGVPAIWCAVNFIAGTIAGLPLHTYRRTGGEKRRQTRSRLARLLHDNVNEEMSSFAWRKQAFERILTLGRSYTLIVRGEREQFRYLWPLENKCVTPRRDAMGRRVYEYKVGKKTTVYPAQDVIDLAFMLKDDGISHYSPILTNKDTIGLGIAATQYGSRFFQNGGVPPFALIGKFQSAGAMDRASQQLAEAVKTAARDVRQALTLPEGHELKELGVDPQKSQLVDLKKHLIEDYARIYQLPPVFLQDLSHGTYSNTEQQDLHFVKHTIKRWCEQFEQELNLKLFGWDRNDRFVEFNIDGLMRGDFKTRFEGYGQGVQHAILTPNEIRAKENLPPLDGGDQLLVQGATVPLASQPTGETDAE